MINCTQHESNHSGGDILHMSKVFCMKGNTDKIYSPTADEANKATIPGALYCTTTVLRLLAAASKKEKQTAEGLIGRWFAASTPNLRIRARQTSANE